MRLVRRWTRQTGTYLDWWSYSSLLRVAGPVSLGPAIKYTKNQVLNWSLGARGRGFSGRHNAVALNIWKDRIRGVTGLKTKFRIDTASCYSTSIRME